MDAHNDGQDSHAEGGHGIHMPDPSLWPIFAGIACLVAGAGLIWWSRDRDSSFAGPLLGLGVAFLLLSAAGWAWEDSRMKRKLESGETHEPREPRYNQVLTFAIPEGQLDAARAKDGIISAVNDADFRDLEGFEDLRITVSPAAAGPSQVLVETTWRGREGLAAYEANKQSLLDLVAAHDGQVTPGTVQVFDMEVVRDTKDTTFKFSLGAASTLLVGLIAGGAALGGMLTAFQDTSSGGGGGNGTPTAAPNPYQVIATDNKFNKTSLEAPPNTAVTFTFTNNGKTKHNLAFYQSSSNTTQAGALAPGSIGAFLDGGATEEVKFTTPGAGTYFFHCDIHPDQMNGQFVVREGAPPPGGAAPPAGGGGAAATTVTATDNKFDKTTLTAPANTDVTFTLDNKGKTKHNLAFFTSETNTTASGALAPGSIGAFLDGGATEEIKFKTPGPGTYFYHCDIHPDQMNGKFTVT